MPNKVEEWCRVVLPDRDLRWAIHSITKEKKTGSLTVHFGQGGITSIEWQQRSVSVGQWPFAISSLNGKTHS